MHIIFFFLNWQTIWRDYITFFFFFLNIWRIFKCFLNWNKLLFWLESYFLCILPNCEAVWLLQISWKQDSLCKNKTAQFPSISPFSLGWRLLSFCFKEEIILCCSQQQRNIIQTSVTVYLYWPLQCPTCTSRRYNAV